MDGWAWGGWVDGVFTTCSVNKAYQKVSENVTLPALRPRVAPTVADRQRRAQELQRERLGIGRGSAEQVLFR